MDNQDAPRKLKLKLFAEQCLERLTNKEPGYTDFQAMQDIYIQAAKLSGNNVDAFMDDLFDILIGHMSLFKVIQEGSGDYAVGNQNLIPMETRKKMKFRGFKDTGFPEYFRDGGNQVNHFTAYFVMGHRYKIKIKDLISFAVHAHEWDSSIQKGKFENNSPDIYLGYFGVNSGYLVSNGELTPLQFSNQLHLFIMRPDLIHKIANPENTPIIDFSQTQKFFDKQYKNE